MFVGGNRTFALIICASTTLLPYLTATASEFDKCVLQHMQGVTSDLAAASIKESCLRTVETGLPRDALDTFHDARAAYGQLPAYDLGGFGLYITLNNRSGYTITEITLQIVDKKTLISTLYKVRDFPFVPPPGVISMGPPRDPTLLKMIGPGIRQFYTRINETTSSVDDWNNRYAWALASAKGFKD
jgi:hypothetical protein